MQWLDTGLSKIADADGWLIAATGLGIVFIALVLIAGFISLMPHFLTAVAAIWPEQEAPHGDDVGRSSRGDENEIAAAIGYVMLARRQSTEGR